MSNTLKFLEEEINRKRKMNALYNAYIKATGTLNEVRLYEDSGEVNFVPVTTSQHINYRNELTKNLSDMMGMKNYEKVLDFVNNVLNDAQVIEVVTNWANYKDFLKPYMKKPITYERFKTEFLIQINKNTAPVQILDKINNLQLVQGTGQTFTDPTKPQNQDPESNDYQNAKDKLTGTSVVQPVNDLSNAEKVNKLIQKIDNYAMTDVVYEFFAPDFYDRKIYVVYMQNLYRWNDMGKYVDVSKLLEPQALYIKKLFIDQAPANSNPITLDDLYPPDFEGLDESLKISYLEQVWNGLRGKDEIGKNGRNEWIVDIMETYEKNFDEPNPNLRHERRFPGGTEPRSGKKKSPKAYQTYLRSLKSPDTLWKIYVNARTKSDDNEDEYIDRPETSQTAPLQEIDIYEVYGQYRTDIELAWDKDEFERKYLFYHRLEPSPFLQLLRYIQQKDDSLFQEYGSHILNYKYDTPFNEHLAYTIEKFYDAYKNETTDLESYRNQIVDEFMKYYEYDVNNSNITDEEFKRMYRASDRGSFMGHKRFLEGMEIRELIDFYKQFMNSNTQGKGLKTKTLKVTKTKKTPKEKYYIDKKSLNKNILEIKYHKNKHLLEKFKSTKISNDLKKKIGKGFLDEYKDEDLDNVKLNAEEKRIYNQLMKLFGNEVDDEESQQLDNKFETIVGQIKAGNDNPLLKQQLRSMLIYAMKTGAMKRNNVLDYFLEFSL